MEEISRNIYYENSFSGVILGAILLPQGTILLDAPLRAEEGRSWRNKLHHMGASPNRVLVNLDAHPDRTLGARGMDCTIIAHQKTAQVFRSRPSVFKGQNADSGSEWETYDDAVGTRWASPNITFTNHLQIHWGPEPVILRQQSGPMPGATWVIMEESNIVFVGDAVLANQPPFLAYADIDQWVESIDFLLKEYKNFTVVSGRDGPVSYETIRDQRRLLRLIQKEMERIIQRDQPLEFIDKRIPTILNTIEFPRELGPQYIHRLRHGMTQYYINQINLSDLLNSDSH